VPVTVVRRAAPVVLAATLLAGCSSSPPDAAPPTQPPQATQPPTATSTSPGPRSPTVTKLLVFVVENHSLDQMSRDMPYTFGLAQQYGYATAFTALTHPSLPNYLAIAGGDMFGVTDDDPPPSHPASGQSVFGQAVEMGRTARTYAEGMSGNCALEDGGDRYAVRHNPWTYFVDERAQCQQYDVSLDTFGADVAAGALPNAGMVIPNACNDAHDSDCDLGDADTWMREHVGQVLAGPDFASGHLAVVVTADEDDRSQDNTVLTTVFHPSLHGNVVDSPLSPYSLTRLYEQVLGAPFLGNAATAPDMAAAFGLRVAG
jgi:phosphatidylinositol-3-phosphatase